MLANSSHGFELALGGADQPHDNVTGACLCEAIEKFGCTGSRPTIASLPLAKHRGGLSIVALQKRVDALLSTARILVHRQRHIDCRREFADVASGVADDLLYLRPLPAPAPQTRLNREPSVEIFTGPLKCRADGARHPDWRPAGAMRLRAEHAAADRPPPVPIDRLPGPQRATKTQAFHHAADTALERYPGGAELCPNIGQIIGDARAEHQPALADLVEGGELVREHDRVAQSRQEHRGAELHLSRARRDGCQQRQWVVARPGQ